MKAEAGEIAKTVTIISLQLLSRAGCQLPSFVLYILNNQKMKTVIVFNHPYERSYCNAILNSVTAGLQKANHEVDIINLDKEGFNPVMTAQDLKAFVDRKPIDRQVIDYKQRLDQADHLVFIFPIWWELMPAMTKGFIDKVIFPGVAYDYTKKGYGMIPLFKKIKSVTVITTMNTPSILYRLVFGNAIRKAILTGTFWKMGYKNRKWISLNMVKMASDAKRKKWLSDIEKRFAKPLPLQVSFARKFFNLQGDYKKTFSCRKSWNEDQNIGSGTV